MTETGREVRTVLPATGPLRGRLAVPGDKSIAHRAVLFNAFAAGRARLSGLPAGGDVRSSLAVVQSLGAGVERSGAGGDEVVVLTGFAGRPARPAGPLDCGNSGTTMRLLMGLLAGVEGTFTLVGDASLSRRPMERVAAPLRAMGADIRTTDGHAPVVIEGSRLKGAEHQMKVASAQLKTALLLAGLAASGTTRVREPSLSRDHSERMLAAMSVRLDEAEGWIELQGPQAARALDVHVPGDPSSAAFLCVAAALVSGSNLVLENVCLNPTRTGFVRVLERMGADICCEVTGSSGGEDVGSVTVRGHGRLRPFVIEADEVPATIDELPILAVAAAGAEGRSTLRGAEELRVKESDRIAHVAKLLRAMGVAVEEHPDGLDIEGRDPAGGIAGGSDFDAAADHRLAMSAAVASLVCRSPLQISDAAAAAVSFPQFFEVLEELRK